MPPQITPYSSTTFTSCKTHTMFRQSAQNIAKLGVRLPLAAPRAYHSVSHPNTIVNPKLPESILFTKAIAHIPQSGFSRESISAAVADLGVLDAIQLAVSASSRHSPEFLLVLFWLKHSRQRLWDHVSDPKLEFHAIRNEYDRAAYLIKTRLAYNRPVAARLHEALSQLVLPYNLAAALEELHNLSDDVAFYAGDDSHDLAWYAKRFALLSIYVKSELFMTQDKSVDFSRTDDYVDSSVASLKAMGAGYNAVEQWSVFTAILTVNLIKSQLARG